MESTTKVMLVIGAVIGAGVATAVVLVLVMRTPPPPDTGEVTLLMIIRDQSGAERSKFQAGEMIIIELSIMNGKSYTVIFEGSSCIASPEIIDAEHRMMFGYPCQGDWARMEIPPGPFFTTSVVWDQRCQSNCDHVGWGAQVPSGQYTVTGRTQGTVNGMSLEAVGRVQIA